MIEVYMIEWFAPKKVWQRVMQHLRDNNEPGAVDVLRYELGDRFKAEDTSPDALLYPRFYRSQVKRETLAAIRRAVNAVNKEMINTDTDL